MKFERETAQGLNTFTAYGEGWVEVGGRRHATNLLVTGERIEAGWTSGPFAQLGAGEIAALADLKPEILLLGTGKSFRFPHPSLLAPLYAAGIGVEVMDTRAACRTYNILLGEGRRVAAAIIVE
jgi:uncharacterized protein